MSIRWFDRETLDSIIVDRIEKVDVVLDIGCGIRPQTFFKARLHICCEPHSEYVQILQNWFSHYPNIVVLQGTAQEITGIMPDKSVDSVFLLDVIEHLDKDDGHLLVLECQRIARRQVIIFTPLGFMPQQHTPVELDGWGLQGGEWQAHKSGWSPDDFDTSWDILGCKDYHNVSSRGNTLDSPFGAFWAIKDIQQTKFISIPAKLAVISHVLPPSPSGQSVVLHRLLRGLNSECYCLLSRKNYDVYAYLQVSASKCIPTSSSRLSAPYYYIGKDVFQLRMPNWFAVGAIFKLANVLLQVFQCAIRTARIMEREKCTAVLACSGDLIDLPVGYLASRWARVPFYAYLFDDYLHQWIQRLHRCFARLMEPLVLKSAAGIIVPNEFLRDEYCLRYKVKPIVIHNPCESSEDNRAKVPSIVDSRIKDGIRIVYTGAVYHAHYDAFRNLISAMKLLDRSDVKLHLYTAQPRELLEQESIRGPVVYNGHLASQRIPEVQRQADILFLPLAFNSPIPEVIRTSAPGKMGEYLASGRPILVHAPVDSFVSWYFRKHKCGLVVDKSDPVMLLEAIRSLLEDANLQAMLGENARMCARTDFSPPVARAKFLKLFRPARRE
jgi:glycosyltransferase involved in cell wall biosynthesis